jgi:PAS domain S-box-containing protein
MRVRPPEASIDPSAALLRLLDDLRRATDVTTVTTAAMRRLPEVVGTEQLALVLAEAGDAPLVVATRMSGDWATWAQHLPWPLPEPVILREAPDGARAVVVEIGDRGGLEGALVLVGAEDRVTHARLAAAHIAAALGALSARDELEAARRVAAREAADRRFLMEAGTLLASSLDFEKTLSLLADLVVPELADWCAVRLVGSDGVAQTVAVSHPDPGKVEVARRFLARNEDRFRGEPHMTTRPLWVPDLHAPDVRGALVDPDSPDFLASIGVTSLLTVTIRAHGEVLGTLILAQAESGRRFTLGDLELAQKLADRAGIAVDNARLYGDAQQLGERLRMALQAGRMGMWDYDARTRRFVWTAELAELHGLPPGEGAGGFREFTRNILAVDREMLAQRIARASADHPHCTTEYRVVRPDGGVRWVECRSRVRCDASGEVVAMSSLCLDLTPRKEAEQALAAERERLSVTLSSIGDAVITTDTAGKVVLLNRVAEQLTGWTMEAAAGRRLSTVFAIEREDGGPVEDPVATVAAGRRIVDLPRSAVLRTREGAAYPVSANAAPIMDREGALVGVVLVFRDMTRSRRMEAEIAKASKLESIGALAGGIAHDFNNILTAIAVNLSLVRDTLPPEDSAWARLAAAGRGCDRARDLTGQLLTFARGGAPVKTLTPTLELLQDACGFALQGSKSRAELLVAPDVAAIVADAGQISQVVHNLVLNASQAMPDGGVVTVRADNVRIGPDSSVPLRPGSYVRVSVSDEGPGIPPEHIGRIFDLFFTTKPNGTGLGLATAYSIVLRHDGHIMVQSEPGRGATFTFYVPRVERPAEAAAPPPRPLPTGGGRVLVMDDDPAIRDTISLCLENLGYRVVCVPDGNAAIARWTEARARSLPFDVAIMDLTIPGGMGGLEALRRLKEIDPDVRAIVSSGYCDDAVVANHVAHGFVGSLPKPYFSADVARVLAMALRPDAGLPDAGSPDTAGQRT